MRRHLLLVGVLLLGSSTVSAQTVRSAVGADAASITAALNSFRSDLGPLATGPSTGLGPNNRREVNWDGVPDSAATPNALPGDFFNLASGNPAGRVRGIQFSTTGTLEVSANAASGVATLFGNRFADNANQLAAFSAERIFAIDGSNEMDVTFSLPGSPSTPALVRGFGAVFTDVEVATLGAATRLDYYNAQNILIHSQVVEAFPIPPTVGDSFKSFSFAGVSFADPIVARVHIVNGGYSISRGLQVFDDLVAMDDFVYGEPVAIPEPATMATVALGLLAVGAFRRRR